MKLYYFDTLTPRKACAVARYVGAPVDYVHVDLGKGEHMTPAYAAINPNQKVPALVDGDRRLWESNAIMAYLAAHSGSDLWPRGDRQIDIIRWLSWDSEHFTRYTGTLFFEHIVKSRFGMGAPDAGEVDAAVSSFRKSAAILNDHLSSRRWLVDENLTIADFAVAVALPYAELAHIPIAEFPSVRRWHDRLSELETWREPWPSQTRQAA